MLKLSKLQKSLSSATIELTFFAKTPTVPWENRVPLLHVNEEEAIQVCIASV
jgi:hypothetical protein